MTKAKVKEKQLKKLLLRKQNQRKSKIRKNDLLILNRHKRPSNTQQQRRSRRFGFVVLVA